MLNTSCRHVRPPDRQTVRPGPGPVDVLDMKAQRMILGNTGPRTKRLVRLQALGLRQCRSSGCTPPAQTVARAWTSALLCALHLKALSLHLGPSGLARTTVGRKGAGGTSERCAAPRMIASSHDSAKRKAKAKASGTFSSGSTIAAGKSWRRVRAVLF